MPLALKMEEGAPEPRNAKNVALDARKAKKEFSRASEATADLWTL